MPRGSGAGARGKGRQAAGGKGRAGSARGGSPTFGKKMQKVFNDQINAELYSAYLYLAISAYFAESNLKGFAHWMRIQFDEEMMHGFKMFDFVIERGGQVDLGKIDKPEARIDSPLAAFELTLEHERKVTGLIHAMVDAAVEERDHASQNFLKWFVDEQVEEEANADDVLQQLRLVGDNPAALFMIDRDLAARPAALAADAAAQ